MKINWHYDPIKNEEYDKRVKKFINIFRPSNMNTTQKVLMLICLMTLIVWLTTGSGGQYVDELYQIVLLAVWLGSFVGIYLFKD